MKLVTSRRSLITGLASLIAMPAIVRASSLMPVKAWTDGWLEFVVHGVDAFGAPMEEIIRLPSSFSSFASSGFFARSISAETRIPLL